MSLNAQQKYEARKMVFEKMRGMGIEPTDAMITDLYASFVQMVEQVMSDREATAMEDVDRGGRSAGWSDKLS